MLLNILQQAEIKMKLQKILPDTNIYKYIVRFTQNIKCLVKICIAERVLSGFTVTYFGTSCVAQTHNIQSTYPAYQNTLVKEKKAFKCIHKYLFLVHYRISFSIMFEKQVLVKILHVSMGK